MSTIRISELPVQSGLPANTENYIIPGVNLSTNTTTQVSLKTISQNLFANDSLVISSSIVLQNNSNVIFSDSSVQNTAASPANYTQSAFDLANTTAQDLIYVNEFAQQAFNIANAAGTSSFVQYAANTANSASANTVYTQGVDLWQNNQITYVNQFSQLGFNTANGANGLAASAYNTANGANGLAISAYDTANGANGLAISAYNQANTNATNITAVNGYAVSAYDTANGANGLAAGAYNTANGANGLAAGAYDTANGANGLAAGAYNTANIAQALAQSAFNYANTIPIIDSYARTTANGANGLAVGAYAQANTNAIDISHVNQYSQSAYNTANGANGLAAGAFNEANLAHLAANSKLSLTGGNLVGDLSISNNHSLIVEGDVTIYGNFTTYQSSSLNVADPLIYIAANNYSSDNVEIGFVGNYNDGLNKHTGFFRDPNTKEFVVFQGYTPEPTNNYINIAHPSFAFANLRSNWIKSNVETEFVQFSSSSIRQNSSNELVVSTNRSFRINTSGNSWFFAPAYVSGGDVFVSPNSRFDEQPWYTQPGVLKSGTIYANNVVVANGLFTNGISLNTVVPIISDKANLAIATANTANNNVNILTSGQQVKIGRDAGLINQGFYGVAIGWEAGKTNQGLYSVAVGNQAGWQDQSDYSVAVGVSAGRYNSGRGSTLLGSGAGFLGSGNNSVAIGSSAAAGTSSGQNHNSIAIGNQAAWDGQQQNNISIGAFAGYEGAAKNSVYIGNEAGYRASVYASNSIAIGAFAARFDDNNYSSSKNSITLNATGYNLHPYRSGLYIAPIRQDTNALANVLYYDANSKEVLYNTIEIGPDQYARDTANGANGLAAGAYNKANNALAATGGTISGDLNITGDLNVLGNTTTVNTNELVVDDSLIYLANNNIVSDLVDIGIVGHYNDGTQAHAGIIRDPNLKEFIFFKGYTPQISANNLIDINDPSFAHANVYANYFKGNLIGTSAIIDGVNVREVQNTQNNNITSVNQYAAAAYGAANTNATNITFVNQFAQSAYDKANTGVSSSIDQYARDTANNTVGVDAWQNTQITFVNQFAQAAYNQANVSTGVANGTSYSPGIAFANTWISKQSVSLGQNAGNLGLNAGEQSVAIGYSAGNTQQQLAVAIGHVAGIGQKRNTVAVGVGAGNANQDEYSVAIGSQAAGTNQGSYSVAIGPSAGSQLQGNSAIAIGHVAGAYNQGQHSIAIGTSARAQDYSIAIGYYAGQPGIERNSIILNASGAAMSYGTANSFYVNPIRNGSNTNILYYDTILKEITYSSLPASIDQYARNTANGANGLAVGAYNTANGANGMAVGAYNRANSAFTQANNANGMAVGAFNSANTNATNIISVNNFAQNAYNKANAAYDYANTLSGGGGSGIDQYARDTANNTVGVDAWQNTQIIAINQFAQSAYDKANTGVSAIDQYARATANSAYNTAQNVQIYSTTTATLGVNFTTDVLIKTAVSTNVNIIPAGFTQGKVLEVWLTNSNTVNDVVVSHGCSNTNSTSNSTGFLLPANTSSYLKYFSFYSDSSNTFVQISGPITPIYVEPTVTPSLPTDLETTTAAPVDLENSNPPIDLEL